MRHKHSTPTDSKPTPVEVIVQNHHDRVYRILEALPPRPDIDVLEHYADYTLGLALETAQEILADSDASNYDKMSAANTTVNISKCLMARRERGRSGGGIHVVLDIDDAVITPEDGHANPDQ